MGGATLVEALDQLDEPQLKQICKDLNISWKGSKGDLIARLEVHVATQGGQYPPELESRQVHRHPHHNPHHNPHHYRHHYPHHHISTSRLREKQQELDAINLQPEAVRAANRCAIGCLIGHLLVAPF